MTRDKQVREQLLLDYHLEQLDDEQRAWIESELLRDAELRAKSDRLGEVLRPLDHWKVTPAPANLADRVLNRITRSVQTQGSGTLAPEQSGTYRRAPFASLREIIAAAACIALLIGAAVPALSAVRSRSQRAMCVTNLGSIFRGTTLYQQAFAGSLPFAGKVLGASWLPNCRPNVPYASNSRHIYLVAKLNYGPEPRHFICPSAKSGRPMRADELASYNDFASARSISYASLNMAGVDPNLRPATPIAYMSDANPLFVDGRFHESVDPNTANSPAHKGRGQSVLILDGSVICLSAPVYGPRRDNLWLAGSIRRYTGTETPAGNDDAFLIPGYPVTDPGTGNRY